MNSEKDIFIVKLAKSITIEPAVFLVSLSTTIENIANSQLVIDKTCEVDFNYSKFSKMADFGTRENTAICEIRHL